MNQIDKDGVVPVLAYPKANTEEIVIQEMDSEMLIYDMKSDKAHHLNETAVAVWNCCDGKTSSAQMAANLNEQLDMNIHEDFIWLALNELQNANLLEGKIDDHFECVSRRDVLFRYAPLAAALPIVMSLVAPPAAHAQSCVALGDPCTVPADCCSNICEGTICG